MSEVLAGPAAKTVYFIIPSEDFLPASSLLDRIREQGVVVETIAHTGHLRDLEQLKNDSSAKILAIDPDFCNWELDTESLASIPDIQAICLSTASFDYANPDEVSKLNIPLVNVPGFNTDSVAEYALCMAIETARRLPMVIKNQWQPVGLTEPLLLKGKTAGIVGLGRVGTRIAEVLHGIGMKVIYWSKHSDRQLQSDRSRGSSTL